MLQFILQTCAVIDWKIDFVSIFFHPKTRPRTFLECFALDSRCSKAKHCRNVSGRVLGQKN